MPSTTIQELPTIGLLALLENTRVALPLKLLDIDARITGDVVAVQLDQVYLQDNSRPLDCTYTFPLPPEASVHRCELHVGDRVIEAKVQERKRAEEIFREQKEKGRRAALATMERENLFNLELGNLQPGDLVRVRFDYVQPVERLDDLRSLRIPLTPSVRYIPGEPLPRANQGTGVVNDTDQVPDASRISPPRIDGLHPDATSLACTVHFDERSSALKDLKSSTHAIVIREDADGTGTEVTLKSEEEIPDRDFVLDWSAPVRPSLSAQLSTLDWNDKRYAVLELNGGTPPDRDEEKPETRDVYILLDRSGSMAGAEWQSACRAVRSFADRLPHETRVDLTLFQSDFTHFTGAPLEASALRSRLGKNGRSLESMGTTGGTNLYPAYRAVLNRKRQFSEGRPAVLLLVTDGMVGNEQALTDLARQSNTCLHLVGIGVAPNTALRSMAEATGGQAVFCSPTDELSPLVSRFASRLSLPVVDQIELPAGWEATEELQLGSLYPHEQRLVLLHLHDDPASVRSLLGQGPAGPIDLPMEVQPVDNPAIALLWARDRIRTLERMGESERALALSLEYNLASQQASFVAWDRAEQVSVASEHLHQPSLDLRMLLSDGMLNASACDVEASLFTARGSARRGIGRSRVTKRGGGSGHQQSPEDFDKQFSEFMARMETRDIEDLSRAEDEEPKQRERSHQEQIKPRRELRRKSRGSRPRSDVREDHRKQAGKPRRDHAAEAKPGILGRLFRAVLAFLRKLFGGGRPRE